LFLAAAALSGQAEWSLPRTLDAAPYRGKAVRLRARVRLENPSPGDRAQLTLRVTRATGEPGFYDDMGDRPIVSPEWNTYEITGEVAPDAASIEIGLRVSGKARPQIDSVSFEALPESVDPAVRQALVDTYARIDRAYAAGDLDTLAGLALPDAQVQIGGESQPLREVLRQVSAQLAQGASYRSRSVVTAVFGDASEATAAVRNETTVTSPTVSRTAASASRDIWVRTAGAWKLKRSVLIAANLETPATGPETARAVAAELRQRAVPLPERVAAVGAAAGGARLVALGEPAYGIREFADLNRSIIQSLIASRGFTVVAIEANWAEARAVDDYVRTGRGDARTAVQALDAWPWETPDLLALVEWIRQWNAAPGHRQVSFAGYDVQPSPEAGRVVIDYLKRFAPEDAGPAELAYAEVRDAERAAAASAQVARGLDEHHRELVQASSPEAWREARQAASVAWQSRVMQIAGKGQSYRGEAMAANVEWLAGEAHPDEKIVLWSHNAHTAAATGASMADWLRRRYGKQLYTIGGAFAEGELRAAEKGELSIHASAPPAEGSGDAVLAAAGIPQFFLDLTSVPPQSALGTWLAQPHRFRMAGATWSDSAIEQAPAKAYDGLIFVRQAHALEMLP
jgi:erythromycin esterase